MEKFGHVDMVIADLDTIANQINQFVSIELQAVDLSGTVEPAYTALLESQPIVETTYGVNWANVRKRYMEQLVTKSFYHNRWGTRIVGVMQTPLYNYLRRHIQFDELATGPEVVIDVFFLLYDYVEGSGPDEAHTLKFDRVVGTSHSSLMTHVSITKPFRRERHLPTEFLRNLHATAEEIAQVFMRTPPPGPPLDLSKVARTATGQSTTPKSCTATGGARNAIKPRLLGRGFMVGNQVYNSQKKRPGWTPFYPPRRFGAVCGSQGSGHRLLAIPAYQIQAGFAPCCRLASWADKLGPRSVASGSLVIPVTRVTCHPVQVQEPP